MKIIENGVSHFLRTIILYFQKYVNRLTLIFIIYFENTFRIVSSLIFSIFGSMSNVVVEKHSSTSLFISLLQHKLDLLLP